MTAFPNATFLDIGANLGFHSLIVAKSGRQVVAVEPMPGILEHLVTSIRLNNISSNIILVKNAMFSERQVVTMQGFHDAKGKINHLNYISPLFYAQSTFDETFTCMLTLIVYLSPFFISIDVC